MGLSVLTGVATSENANELSLATLIKHLPMDVRHKLRTDVLEAAIRSDLIEITREGKLRWLSGNNTLLAYFCGRMWSGDHGKYSRRKGAMLWQMGNGEFPAASLNRLFGTSALKQTRSRRKNMALPKFFEMVDNLFDAAPK